MHCNSQPRLYSWHNGKRSYRFQAGVTIAINYLTQHRALIKMHYTTLGRTQLRVSAAGLGCGGSSRLGQQQGMNEQHSIDVVKRAIDLGVNFIDTAMVYGTEEIVGKAVKGQRDRVVISSKARIIQCGAAVDGEELCTSTDYGKRLDGCLQRLGTDYIDIFHLHGVMAHQLDYCVEQLVPALQRARDQGKIRFIGLTERFIHDTTHQALLKALGYDCFDVFMVGFNLLNFSARRQALAITRQHNIGTLCMFALRRALSNETVLMETLRRAVDGGQLSPQVLTANPLAWLVEQGYASSLTDAAYRFCRHEPGINVVLTGTGNIEHLESNIASINEPPLAPTAQQRIETLFGAVDCVSGN